VINAIIAFLEYVFNEGEIRQHMVGLMIDIREEIFKIYKQNDNNNFSLI